MRYVLTAIGAALMLGAGPAAAEDAQSRITMVFDQALPNVAGKSLRVVLVEYGPGESSPAHTHAPTAFILARVLEGRVRSQVEGEPSRVYGPGEMFVELPGSHHLESANASDTERSKLLATFVVDTDDTVLTTFDPH